MPHRSVFWLACLCLFVVVGCSVGTTQTSLAATSFPQSTTEGGSEPRANMTDLWVDPIGGDDTNDGATRATALQTVIEAWGRIPAETELGSTGYRMRLVAGTYETAILPHYMEHRWGTATAPIVIEAADGAGTAVLQTQLNVFDTRYLQVLDLVIRPVPASDTFHCEQCDHMLLRGNLFDGGTYDPNGTGDIASDNVKVNQSRFIYLENNEVRGATDNAIDFVAVQDGHLRRNRIHNAQDWCAYAKGGSANLIVEGNEIWDCGTGGFTAGQGTGFQFMTPPWTHYEANGIKVVNNVIHDTAGAGVGVNGGYNVLVAHNTLYRVGSRSHTIEITYGSRSCDGQPGDDGRDRCDHYLAAGGWGTVRVDDGTNYVRIPNKHVYVYNNIIYNLADAGAAGQLFFIPGPFEGDAQDGSNVPVLARADTDIQIRGNLIWNGGSSAPLGIEESDQGCQPDNPSCNATQLRADNTIDTAEPQLVDPAHGDWRPVEGGNVTTARTFAIPAFPNNDPAGSEPPTTISPDVTTDYAAHRRATPDMPGAFTVEGGAPPTMSVFAPFVFR